MFNISINQDSGAACGAYSLTPYPTAAYADAGRRRGERAHDILLWLGAFSPARRLLRVVIVLACMCITALAFLLFAIYCRFNCLLKEL